MRNKLLISIFIISLCLASCRKETPAHNPQVNNTLISKSPSLMAPIVIPDPLSRDGFGSSTKPLKGFPFLLPDGVTMIDSIRTNINSCTSSIFYTCITDGDLPLYFSLRNNNPTPINVIFPAGMLIPSCDTSLQGGVIVQPNTVMIPANNTLCVNLNVHCLNQYRFFNNNSAFSRPLISNNRDLLGLTHLLSNKKPIEYDNNQAIQRAVWDIANIGRLTAADSLAISQFP